MCRKMLLLIVVLSSLLIKTDCQLDKFGELQKVEKDILKSVIEVVDIAKKSDIGIVGAQKHILDNVVLSGSITGGSAMSALFKHNKDGLNRELPVGVTFDILQIPQKYDDLVEDVSDRVGFVKVRVNKDAMQFLSSMQLDVKSKEYSQLIPQIVQDGYLKPYKLKHLVLKTLEEKAGPTSNMDGLAELFWAVIFEASLESLKISKPPHQLSKLPTSSFVDVFIDKKLKLKFSWNIATTIKLNWWPQVAQEFITRTRQWPDPETIKTLTQTSFITLIPSDEESEDKESQELIYAFTHVENMLAALRSDQQSLVFLIFKSILNAQQIGVDEAVANHIMLWTCEEIPPDNLLWEDTSTKQALSVLFGKLLVALESKSLSNYFISQQNILKELDETTRLAQIKKVQDILSSSDKSAPSNVKEAIKAGKDILKTIKFTHKVIKDLAEENYDIFLQRTDLMMKALEIFGMNFLNMGGAGNKNKDSLLKTAGDVKDTVSGLWNDLQDTLKSEDVQKTMEEKINKAKDSFDLDDIEKKAKEWMDKWEL